MIRPYKYELGNESARNISGSMYIFKGRQRIRYSKTMEYTENVYSLKKKYLYMLTTLLTTIICKIAFYPNISVCYIYYRLSLGEPLLLITKSSWKLQEKTRKVTVSVDHFDYLYYLYIIVQMLKEFEFFILLRNHLNSA